jgi:hypothetical protein
MPKGIGVGISPIFYQQLIKKEELEEIDESGCLFILKRGFYAIKLGFLAVILLLLYKSLRAIMGLIGKILNYIYR